MTGHSEDAGRQRTESDRCSGRSEGSRGRHLSRPTSRQFEQDIQDREVMASRHNLSRVQMDRLQSVEESISTATGAQLPKPIRGNQCTLITSCLQRDEDKRAGKHKFKQGSVIVTQSRKKHSEPEEEQQAGMPTRRKKPLTPKPFPMRMGRRVEGTNDQSLKGRLTSILSSKTDECTCVLPPIEWG